MQDLYVQRQQNNPELGLQSVAHIVTSSPIPTELDGNKGN